jgi:hypothetical protein
MAANPHGLGFRTYSYAYIPLLNEVHNRPQLYANSLAVSYLAQHYGRWLQLVAAVRQHRPLVPNVRAWDGYILDHEQNRVMESPPGVIDAATRETSHFQTWCAHNNAILHAEAQPAPRRSRRGGARRGRG